MKTQTDKAPEQQSDAAPKIQQEQSTGGTATITDNRPATVYQRKLRETMNAHAASKALPVQRKKNSTGLPDNLKSGIENLSGYAMDDVKVHYNSSKPAQLQAHAYAQGTDIHLAPGQEKHLPHEAWHVVQQKQGRVKPTMQLKSRVNINDDAGLEKEADVMGSKALSVGPIVPEAAPKKTVSISSAPVQRRNNASPQNFQSNAGQTNADRLELATNHTWNSSTNNMADLNDIRHREVITFNQNPANLIPTYPGAAAMIPGMTLNGNTLIKETGTMQNGAGTDNHQGAGFGPSFYIQGVQNLHRGNWVLTGTQYYEYFDPNNNNRFLGFWLNQGWVRLHQQPFIITRTMTQRADSRYEMTFSKTGPGGINMQVGPTVISEYGDTNRAIADYGNVTQDQTPLQNDLDNAVQVRHVHQYQLLSTDTLRIHGQQVNIRYELTVPQANAGQAPQLTPEQRTTLRHIKSGVNKIKQVLRQLNPPPQNFIVTLSDLPQPPMQQSIYTAANGGTYRVFLRFQSLNNLNNLSIPGQAALEASRNNEMARYEEATLIHEMGHMLHAFSDRDKFLAATVMGFAGINDNGTQQGTPAFARLQMRRQIALDNEAVMGAVGRYVGNLQPRAAYKYPSYGKMKSKVAPQSHARTVAAAANSGIHRWFYSTVANPAEVVAEVFTALMTGQTVPEGLAAVYVAYGGVRTPKIDRALRVAFGGQNIPNLNTPRDAINYL